DSCENTLGSITASNNSDYGIYLKSSSNNNLSNITALNNSNYGIYLSSSNNNILSNITASNNDYGILLSSSTNNTLRNTTLSDNHYNFGILGSDLNHFIQNIDTSNTVNGKPIYYYVSESDKVIPSDAGFIGIINSRNITARDLILTNNSHGILIVNSTDSAMSHEPNESPGFGLPALVASFSILAYLTRKMRRDSE
ncbi:MAG: right-handed parallel beta-helix repeat-containing protein, partial [Archaeoglobi archaeon]|nr:right-handed parallel beta-helix repeat-containing protein [Candidatus Mnemosynella bozhongmuii]